MTTEGYPPTDLITTAEEPTTTEESTATESNTTRKIDPIDHISLKFTVDKCMAVIKQKIILL